MRYLKKLNLIDSNKTQAQILRLETILNQYKNEINENKEIISMMDTNINTSHQSDHNKIYKVSKLYDIFTQFITDYDLTIHNNKNTHFPLHKSPSCIDHIVSNIPNKITNTTTHKNINSDHSYITATYTTKDNIYSPKFISIRDNKKLNRENLKLCFDMNDNFIKLIHLQHPNDIANNLQLELNTIVNTIAPFKIVQFKKDFIPYYDNDIR